MPIKAVVFDIDGTLVHSTPHCLSITNQLLVSNNRSALTSSEYSELTKYDTASRFTAHLHGEAALTSPEFPKLYEDGLRLGAEFDALYVSTLSSTNCPLYPGIKMPLLSLASKGVKLAALTNACLAYATSVFLAHGLSPYFSEVAGADSVPASKP
ncbi:hypothetical protein TrRE_jg2677, partial [Triparma retinervis]